MKATVFIATYKNNEKLYLCLHSLNHQTERNFEVIVGDDGGDAYNFLRGIEKELNFKWIYFWQPDEEYRRGELLNRCIPMASGNVIVLTDADCMLVPSFVQSHLEIRQMTRYEYTTSIDSKVTKVELTREIDEPSFFIGPRVFLADTPVVFETMAKDGHFIDIDRFKLSTVYRGNPNGTAAMQGCNVSFLKKHFLETGGIEPKGRCREYPYAEDIDLNSKLKGIGCIPRPTPDEVLVYHLGLPWLSE